MKRTEDPEDDERCDDDEARHGDVYRINSGCERVYFMSMDLKSGEFHAIDIEVWHIVEIVGTRIGEV